MMTKKQKQIRQEMLIDLANITLTNEYMDWVTKEKLPPYCAEELLNSETPLKKKQRDWLKTFCTTWEIVNYE